MAIFRTDSTTGSSQPIAICNGILRVSRSPYFSIRDGLIALGLFCLLAIKRAASRAWHGDLHAAAAISAFSSFLMVGLFDTLIDSPRFLFLFLLLGWFGGVGFTNETRYEKELRHA